MSRETVTITAPNGVKVRTVRSKRYFTVAFGTAATSKYAPEDLAANAGGFVYLPPAPFARVERRSDDVEACRKVARTGGHCLVVRVDMIDGRPVVRELYRYEGGVCVADHVRACALGGA